MSTGNIIETAGGSITTHTANDLSLYADNVTLAAADKVGWKGMDNGVILGDDPKDPDEGKVLVKSAYFAKKVEKKIKTVTDQEYKVAAGDTHTSIAQSVKGVNAKELKHSHPKLKPDETISLKVHSDKKELSLERVSTSIIGAKVFVVVETVGLKDATLTIEILGSNNTTFVKPDEVVSVLIGGEEKASLSAKVGDYSTKTEYTNATSFANKAIAEIELKPKGAEKLKDWRKKIGDSTEKEAFLHLQIKVDSPLEIIYYNDDDKITEPAKDKGIYLNKQKGWFGLFACYCDRDLTVDELKEIVKEMRESEQRKSFTLFTSNNCTLDSSDKSYERLCEELNKTFKTHHINSCIRKMHFFAQIYWEGDRLQTTLEYSSGEYLDPSKRTDAAGNGNTKEGDGPRYKGRGLMQLTWRNSQKSYFEYVLDTYPNLFPDKKINELLDRGKEYEETYYYSETIKINGKKVKVAKSRKYEVDSAALIASNLFFAVDSAGWFWDVYKTTRNGNNINYYADFGDAHMTLISTLVNGGGNGRSERQTYYERLRDNIFKFKNTCINYDKIKK